MELRLVSKRCKLHQIDNFNEVFELKSRRLAVHECLILWISQPHLN